MTDLRCAGRTLFCRCLASAPIGGPPRCCRTGRRRAADRDVALGVEGMARQVMGADVPIDVVIGPGGHWIDLGHRVRLVPGDDRGFGPLGGVDPLQPGDPCRLADQVPVERLDLAQLTAARRPARLDVERDRRFEDRQVQAVRAVTSSTNSSVSGKWKPVSIKMTSARGLPERPSRSAHSLGRRRRPRGRTRSDRSTSDRSRPRPSTRASASHARVRRPGWCPPSPADQNRSRCAPLGRP